MDSVTVEYTCHFKESSHGKRNLLPNEAPKPVEPGNVPRISKLMPFLSTFPTVRWVRRNTPFAFRKTKPSTPDLTAISKSQVNPITQVVRISCPGSECE